MANEKLLDWCKETFGGRRGTWLSEPENLILIHNKLQEYGQKLADTHHHYIPAENFTTCEKTFDLKWYEEKEIEVFRGDGRFWVATGSLALMKCCYGYQFYKKNGFGELEEHVSLAKILE